MEREKGGIKEMTVALIFGGKSSEHSVSVATAVLAFDALKNKYNVLPVYVDKNGVWRKGKLNAKPALKKLRKGRKIKLRFPKPYFYTAFKKIKIDCAVLCLHGVNGEDGTVQSVLRLANIPFTGCDVTASAVGMDKIIMKDVFKANGIDCVEYLSVNKEEYETCAYSVKSKARLLGYPLIVKPANAGSSIGISLARNGKELEKAITGAFLYDNRLIIEKALTDFIEVNCAVLKSEERFYLSDIEQPVKKGEILDYIDKYSIAGKLPRRNIPANIDKEVALKVRELALACFKALGCSGVARIDFLVDKDNRVYVNEINTIPGSLSFYLFVTSPFSPEKICDLLIADAFYNQKRRNELSYSYLNEIFATKS